MHDRDVGPYLRRLEMALRDRHYDRAHRIVDEAELAASSPADTITLSTPLASIDVLPVRVVNLLSRAGIDTVRDILHRTPNELAELPSIGPESVRSIVKTLRALPITVG